LSNYFYIQCNALFMSLSTRAHLFYHS
jgi:hypothetical protein